MPADPYYDNVTLLLHGEGVNGGTVFTDNSPSPIAMTPHGTPTTSTASFTHGTSSILMPASPTSWFGLPNGIMNFGTDDFTIEFRVKVDTDASESGYPYLLQMGSGSSNRGFYIYADGVRGYYLGTKILKFNGYGSIPALNSTSLIAGTGWRSIAIVRYGLVHLLFVDGQIEASNTGTVLAPYVETSDNRLWSRDGSSSYKGNIDELRITKGVARYTNNYDINVYSFLNSPTDILDSTSNTEVMDGVRGVITSTSDTIETSEDTDTVYIINQILSNSIESSDAIANYRESYNFINSGILLSDPFDSVAVINTAIQDLLNSLDSVGIILREDITSGFKALSSISSTLKASRDLLESITNNDTLSNSMKAYSAILDSSNLVDTTLFGLLKAITDSINILESISTYSNMNSSVLESIEVDEIISSIYEITDGVEDSLSVLTDLDSSSIFSQIVVDLFSVFESIEKDLEYISYLLSPETFSVSTYSNYSFTGSCVYEDTPLFINNDGLYKYGGTLDINDSIISSIQTAALSFGTSNLKQVPNIYLGISNSNRLLLKVAVDGQADILYNLTKKTDGLQTQNIPVGKGLIGRYFQFELITQESTRFELESIEFLPVTLKRKL